MTHPLKGLVMAVWGLAALMGWSGMALAADKLAPTSPRNFQAVVASGSPIVTLTWGAASDASGVALYRLERSLDQEAWKPVGESITELTYRDTETGFGLHYYYRLAAVDKAGNVSAWVMTDVRTDSVGGGPRGSAEMTVKSLDNLVEIKLPAGAVASEISCNLNKLQDVSGQKIGTVDEPLVVGPYELVCRTTAGSLVTDYILPASWTISVKDKLKRLKDPVVYTYDTDAKATPARDAEYDSEAQVFKVQLPPNAVTAVQGKVPKGIPLNAVVIFLVVVAIVAGIIVFALHRKKKLEYEEYLRSKYNNL
jgi:hypothetical protein